MSKISKNIQTAILNIKLQFAHLNNHPQLHKTIHTNNSITIYLQSGFRLDLRTNVHHLNVHHQFYSLSIYDPHRNPKLKAYAGSRVKLLKVKLLEFICTVYL